MLCLLYTFIDLYTYYTGYLWLDKVGVDRERMVYPLALALHRPPPLHPLPPLLLPPPPGHPPHIQEFVMIPNSGDMEFASQPLFPPHPSPPQGHKTRISPFAPNSTPFLTPSQPSS